MQPLLPRVIPHAGAFPVDRGNSDRETIHRARRVLRTGHLLGIFVEGTRQTTDEIGAGAPGAACSRWSRAPIVPVVIRARSHQEGAPSPGHGRCSGRR